MKEKTRFSGSHENVQGVHSSASMHRWFAAQHLGQEITLKMLSRTGHSEKLVAESDRGNLANVKSAAVPIMG